jgi:hypothetical protein
MIFTLKSGNENLSFRVRDPHNDIYTMIVSILPDLLINFVNLRVILWDPLWLIFFTTKSTKSDTK